MAGQLPLPFEIRPALGRSDFVVTGCNRAALAWIERWPWPGSGLIVHGPSGCGKTHLAHVLRTARGGSIIPAASLAGGGAELPPSPLTAGRVLVVEDFDGPLTGLQEQALLHLYNRIAESSAGLMVTALKPAPEWGLRLPDLRSRMLALPSVAVDQPDDELLAAVLVKHFADRQVRVGRDVVDYLVVRIERSFAAARDAAETIDRMALVEARAVTVALARRALAQIGSNADSIPGTE